jgi:preprotein translocase subunit YajC
MTTTGNSTIQSVVSCIVLAGMYAFVFWRTAKRENNKVIEFGGLALGSMFLMAAVMKVPNIPEWVLAGMFLLFALLSFLMFFFLVRQGIDALRRRRQSRKGDRYGN